MTEQPKVEVKKKVETPPPVQLTPIEEIKQKLKKGEKIEGANQGGLMKLTLRELDKVLQVQFADIISIRGYTMPLTWEKVINIVNYNAKRDILSLDNTLEDAFTVIPLFLM